jgi:hypothetical protein
MDHSFPTVARADAGTRVSRSCPRCGRKRLARTPTCLFCGKKLPALTDDDQPDIATPRRLARQKVLANLSPILRIDDEAGGGIEDLKHPLFDRLLDGEFLDQGPQEILDQDLQLCHYCGKTTRSLKDFELPTVLFLLPLYIPSISLETEPISACQGCMRWYIAKFMLCNIVTANLLWPLFSLLPSLFLFAMTIPKGHSTGARWTRA